MSISNSLSLSLVSWLPLTQFTTTIPPCLKFYLIIQFIMTILNININWILFRFLYSTLRKNIIITWINHDGSCPLKFWYKGHWWLMLLTQSVLLTELQSQTQRIMTMLAGVALHVTAVEVITASPLVSCSLLLVCHMTQENQNGKHD